MFTTHTLDYQEMKTNFRKIQCKKIQVENIFLWLKILPLYDHLYSQHPPRLLHWHTTAYFSLVVREAHWAAATKMNSKTVN